jgi:hypothetical protein
MNKPVIKFGVLYFEWRGFSLGIFERQADGDVKMLEHHISDSSSLDEFDRLITSHKNDIKTVIVNRFAPHHKIKNIVGRWIGVFDCRDITDIPKVLTETSMLLCDGKILMTSDDAKYFNSELRNSNLNELTNSIQMLLTVGSNWGKIQMLGIYVPPPTVRWS